MGEKDIQIRKRFDPSLPPIRGDRAQLIQVFLNLVKNAFQAMEANGALTVTTRLETDYHVRGRGNRPGRIIWEQTITDPKVYTRPFTMRVPLGQENYAMLSTTGEIWEVDCWESLETRPSTPPACSSPSTATPSPSRRPSA